MTIKMILATGLNGELGKDNKLLWDIPEDMKYFREKTTGHSVVMGRNTYESIVKHLPQGLPNRENVVISKSLPDLENFTIIDSISWIKKWSKLITKLGDYDVWIIGGESLYSQFKDIVDEVHWTTISKTFPEADTFFDMKWVEQEDVFEKVNEEKLCDLATVLVYKRK